MKIESLKIVVTGAASGMGKHFSLRLAELGAEVVACDIALDALEELPALAADYAGKIHPMACDVSNEDAVVAMIHAAYDKMGGLNGLVNNAGIFRDGMLVKKDRKTGDIRKMSLANWQKVLDVDLTGPFLCTREFAAKVIETGTEASVIVNISSVSRHGNMGQSNYSAAKAGLVADTTLWSRELARHGVRVAAMAPGFVDTPILSGMPPAALEKVTNQIPLRRLGSQEELFLGLKFVLECDYFTGRCLDIDGGLRL